MFEHPVNDVEELVHDGSDDDDLWLSLCFEAGGKFFADRVEAHGGHCWEKQVFAQLAVAGFAHGCSSFPACSRLEMSRRDASVGRQFAPCGEVFQIG